MIPNNAVAAWHGLGAPRHFRRPVFVPADNRCSDPNLGCDVVCSIEDRWATRLAPSPLDATEEADDDAKLWSDDTVGGGIGRRNSDALPLALRTNRQLHPESGF